MTFAKAKAGRAPRLEGITTLLPIVSIIAVPLLTFFFPRWAARMAVPLLAITSVGIYATVPDTERVKVVMAAMLVAGAVCLATRVTLAPLVPAALAFMMMGEAILDSGSRGAPMVRAAGCFGVFLVAPVAAWLQQWRADDGDQERERRPALITLIAVHCVLMVWSSRLQIRETSSAAVVLGTGLALVLGTAVLFATARPVAPTP